MITNSKLVSLTHMRIDFDLPNRAAISCELYPIKFYFKPMPARRAVLAHLGGACGRGHWTDRFY